MSEQNPQEIKKVIDIVDDNSALIRFFDGSMNKATSLVRHFDSQANILVGIDMAVVGFALSHLINGGSQIIFFSLLAFSTVSLICALYAVHPPRFMRKKGQNESLFYNKKIISFDSAADYSKAVVTMLDTKEELILNYSTEIYNLYKYFYRPKRKLFKLSRDTLMFGIIVTMILVIITS